MFDCHMHTKFSTDSIMDASAACERSIALGLEGIAFTDHLDIDFPGGGFMVNFDDYFSEIATIRANYGKEIKILDAIEVGIQPHVLDGSMKTVAGYPFDYVLASVHVLDGLDPSEGEFYKDKPRHEAYELYLKEIYRMIKTFESFDMVGHFDYIIRYAPYEDRMLRYNDHRDILDAIMIELVKQGRGFELNTGTYRKNEPGVDYDFELLKRYRQLGGELICLGSDAHRQEHIGLRFEYFSQMVRDAGFKYSVHFEKRKPVFSPL
ncbi:MAG: histidinol-phosphatase HisJ family protein [Clostridiaceae bacterium]|nr:histidinol-phosphatase HisJ family protein [Clostridiaceae bacterium]